VGASATQGRVVANAGVVPAAPGLGAVRPFASEGERAGLRAGGPAPGWSFAKLPIQAKLTVGEPGDKLEQEADQVADRVMRMPDPAAGGVLQRKCAGCEDEEKNVQRKADGGPVPEAAAPPIVHEVLRGPGEPLDAGTRAFMEPRFGYDFSGVRVHTGAQAAESAAAVEAHAYTVGSDIVLRSAPGTEQDKRLLAHELAHVVQQGASPRRLQRSGEDGAVPQPQPTDTTAATAASLPGEDIRPPGDCGLVQYAGLALSVETAKAIVNGLGGCRPGDSCERLAFKIAAFAAEIAAREAINTACFKGGNKGHIDQVRQKLTALNDCYDLFQGSNCSPELVKVMEVVVEQVRGLLAGAAVVVAVAAIVALVAAIIALVEAILAAIAAAAAAAAEAAALVAAAATLTALLVTLKNQLSGGDKPSGA
jgi:Domain of unknown function (DUF4157)/Novel toxin 16